VLGIIGAVIFVIIAILVAIAAATGNAEWSFNVGN
jgi:hypothetical protein